MGPDDGTSLGDPEVEVLDLLEHRAIRRLVQGLPERQRLVIQMRYLNDDERRRLSDVGERLGVTGERVRQIESRALAALGRMPEARALRTASTCHG